MKKLLRNRAFWLSNLLALAPILVGLAVYDKLPQEMAIHFNVEFEPDGFAPRLFAVTVVPLFVAGVNLVVWFFTQNDPTKENISKSLLNCLYFGIPALSFLLQLIVIGYALGWSGWILHLIPFAVGILFIALGNYLPKCRENYEVGVRLPWTLSSAENWRRTNRLAGKLMVGGGVILILCAFVPPAWVFAALALLAVGIGVILTAYSYYLYKHGI